MKNSSPIRMAALAATVISVFAVQPANAVPTLQLDILNGFYVGGTEESVFTEAPAFTLYAFATPGNLSAETILGTEYFLSIALAPKIAPPGGDLGSFTIDSTAIDGETVNATADMTFGTPPIGATSNPLLGSHDVFETYFAEFSFYFDAADTVTQYNTQDYAGAGLFDDAGGDMFYVAFEIDANDMVPVGYNLHFDLYSVKIKHGDDITVDDFAPFSHDAQAQTPEGTPNTTPVPEPASLALFGLGLAGLAFTRA